MRYVIIGNSTAAVGVIEGIRSIDKDSQIYVIGDEKHFVYSRPTISYYVLGKVQRENMNYRGKNFYEDNHVTTVLGEKVTKIDNTSKAVFLANGDSIKYDKLAVCTGSSTFVPPVEGLNDYHTFYTLDDAINLDNAINNASNVLIAGAGLIGLKCAEAIAHKVKSVTVVDMQDRVLSSILDKQGADIIQSQLEKHNIKFVLNDAIMSFDKTKAITNSGKSISYDVLVMAVGVRPNIQLMQEIGAKINRGIVVDSHQQTSINDIYSAGDCCTSYDISADTERVLALLPNAYMQGEVAGKNMAGGDEVFEKAIPMNAIGFFGVHIITAGSYKGECTTIIEKDNYKKLFVEDNKLKGYMIIGDIKRAGIYTNLIKEQTAISDIDFELVSKKPSLLAFTREYRDAKLGGAR